MTYTTPSLATLVLRLRQLNQDVPDNPTAQQLADIINAALADQACCSRALIDGKPKLLKFCDYHAAVFGVKWKYVPHGERGLLRELPGSWA